MKTLLQVFTCFVSLWAGPLIAKQQPNVILIYSDDQGSIDANCYGSKDLATPTLDKLAAPGVRFTQMYSPSAICSASRAGLLTGRFPPRAGVPGNVANGSNRIGILASNLSATAAFRRLAAPGRFGYCCKFRNGCGYGSF